jgi:hypothetical protein
VSTSVVKWSEGLRNRVYNSITSYEVCCLYGCFVYHILSYSFGSIFYHCIYGYVLYASVEFCKLCILIVMFMCSYCYVPSVLCILFHFVVLCIVCV